MGNLPESECAAKSLISAKSCAFFHPLGLKAVTHNYAVQFKALAGPSETICKKEPTGITNGNDFFHGDKNCCSAGTEVVQK